VVELDQLVVSHTVVGAERPGRVAADRSDTVRAHRPRSRSARDVVTSSGFLVPAVALVAVMLLAPFVWTIWDSLTNDNGSQASFVGVSNYTALVRDPAFDRSVVNTLVWLVGTLVLPVLLGLAIAVMTSAMPWGKYARSALVLPYTISGSATAVVWGFILRSDGALNSALGGLGLSGAQREWLLSWPTNTVIMILASTWQATGVNVILFLVGLQGIPRDTLEAGAVDGATGFRLFRYITLPQLRAATVVVVGIALANALKAFDLIWILTQGGPARSSETLALTMYRETFLLNQYGYGSAVAVFLTVVVVVASFAYLRRQMPARS